jgi:hypothetical protein
MKIKRERIKIIFMCGVIVFALVVGSGCTQPFDAASEQVIPEETKHISIPTPTVMAPGTSLTVSSQDTTRAPVKTQTTNPTVIPIRTPTGTPTTTLAGTSDTDSYFCTSDKCGTLMISLTCNPRILFRRVAILKIKNPDNATERSAAVAAMGNKFVNVLPDGSVLPVKLNPGRYTLILLNEKNVQVPETGVIKSMGSVYVAADKITKYEFKEECRPPGDE